jgi:hypothetical protein
MGFFMDATSLPDSATEINLLYLNFVLPRFPICHDRPVRLQDSGRFWETRAAGKPHLHFSLTK